MFVHNDLRQELNQALIVPAAMECSLRININRNKSVWFYALLFLCSPYTLFAQTDFQRALQLIESDYPNFHKTLGSNDFVQESNKLLKVFDQDTFITLCHVIDQFNDPHLTIVQPNSLQQLNRIQIQQSLGTSYPKNSRCGLYTNEYRTSIISVTISNRNYIKGIIIKSADSALLSGYIILNGKLESPNIFYGSYIDEFSKKRRGGRIEFLSDSVFTTGAYAKWRKISSSEDIDLASQPYSVDVQFPSSSTTIVKIPCSDLKCKKALDSLILVNHSNILSRDTMVIDLRKNVGGKSSIIDALLPYAYTNPIVRHQTLLFGTRTDLIESQNELKAAKSQQPRDTALIQAWSEWIKLESANIGKFMPGSADTIVFPNVLSKPSKVQVVIDYSNQSAAELIILMLKQSSKVTTWGERTHGGIDFLDYRPVKLVTDKYLLYIPTSKRVIPKHGIKYDNVGIYPDKALHLMPEARYLSR